MLIYYHPVVWDSNTCIIILMLYNIFGYNVHYFYSEHHFYFQFNTNISIFFTWWDSVKGSLSRLLIKKLHFPACFGISSFLPYQSRDGQRCLPSRSDGGASLTTEQHCNFVLLFVHRHKLDLRCRRSNLWWRGRWARQLYDNRAAIRFVFDSCLLASMLAREANWLIWQLVVRLTNRHVQPE